MGRRSHRLSERQMLAGRTQTAKYSQVKRPRGTVRMRWPAASQPEQLVGKHAKANSKELLKIRLMRRLCRQIKAISWPNQPLLWAITMSIRTTTRQSSYWNRPSSRRVSSWGCGRPDPSRRPSSRTSWWPKSRSKRSRTTLWVTFLTDRRSSLHRTEIWTSKRMFR